MKSANKKTQTLTEKIAALPAPRRDIGTVKALVIRPDRGTRLRVDSIKLTPEGGIEGDRWGKVQQTSRRRQVSMIRGDILDLLSNGENQETSGDNIHVDFDLSHDNLPAGTLVSIGSTVLKVSPTKHLPCEQFVARFGQTAFDVAADKGMLLIRARGVLFEVVREGTAAIGDKVSLYSESI